jgi:signal transduction histidine kinase
VSARLSAHVPAAVAALVAEETDEPTIVYPLIQLGDRALAARTTRSRLLPAAATAVLEVGSAYVSAAITGDVPPDVLGVALLLVGPALVLGRRAPFLRATVALSVAILYAWLGYPVGLLGLAGAVLLARAAFGGRLLACFALAVAGGGLAIAASAADPSSVPPALAGIYAAGLVAVCFGADGRRIRRQRDAALDKANEQARLRRSAEERTLIARDLHAGLSRQVSMMSARARIARSMVEGGRSPVPGLTPRVALDDVTSTAAQVLSELRAVGGLLDTDRGPARVPSPGLAGMPELVRTWAEAGLEVRVVGTADRLLRAVDQAAYRFVEEGVAEVSRRSSGLVATVYLEELGAAGGNRLAVTVADSAATERLGLTVGSAASDVTDEGLPETSAESLLAVQQRVEALGATVIAGPVGRVGWVIRAVLPIA